MAAAAAMLLSGCSPEVGLPAVHDMPPPRAEAPLSPDQVKQATDQLANERDHLSTAAQPNGQANPTSKQEDHGGGSEKAFVDRAVRHPPGCAERRAGYWCRHEAVIRVRKSPSLPWKISTVSAGCRLTFSSR